MRCGGGRGRQLRHKPRQPRGEGRQRRRRRGRGWRRRAWQRHGRRGRRGRRGRKKPAQGNARLRAKAFARTAHAGGTRRRLARSTVTQVVGPRECGAEDDVGVAHEAAWLGFGFGFGLTLG